MNTPPTGTVTFLFTDIEGSTALWEREPAAMHQALTRHDALVEQIVARHGGVVVRPRGEGDSRFAVFARASDAVAAAAALQQALSAEPWSTSAPLRVRMALHTGEADLRDGDYYGSAVNRCARLRAAAHGGQTLVSLATEELVREHLPATVALRDLGVHRLKDLTLSERIYQLVVPGIPPDFPPLKTLDNYPHNLPAQPSPLIGRERDAQLVRERLLAGDVHLLTLTGPGGIGKTRLALAVASSLLDRFPDGVWLVRLAPIDDPAFVGPAIAATLGVKETAQQMPVEGLQAHLADRCTLLVLDTFEHVVGAGPLLLDLLAAAPRLSILVTSRSILHLYGEHEFAVSPLALPDADCQAGSVEHLSHYAAVELFVQCAQAALPAFQITDDTAPVVAEICRRLDGLPLAIELAAARSKVFSPPALLRRLQSRLDLPSGSVQGREARQQTLRSTIDWSYALLGADEQRLFARLGVFAGGCSIVAAKAVCHADLDGLQALADQSLLQVGEDADGEPRFTMLETICDYALERLDAIGKSSLVHRDHARYILALAREAAPALTHMQQRPWFDRLEAEHDNIREVLRWALDGGEAELALDLCGTLAMFWMAHGYYTEGYAWTERALHQTASAGVPRANALHAAGLLSGELGNNARATHWLEQALALYRTLGDRSGIAWALVDLGRAARNMGDFTRAVALEEESLNVHQAGQDRQGMCQALLSLGDVALDQRDLAQAKQRLEQALDVSRAEGSPSQIAWSLHLLGRVAYAQGELPLARAYFTQSVDLFREFGWQLSIAEALLDLGRVAHKQGDTAEARSRYAESLALYHACHSYNVHVAECLEGLAEVYMVLRQPAGAARLLGAAETVRATLRTPIPPATRDEYDRAIAAGRSQLDEARWQGAWAEGRALTAAQATADALEGEGASHASARRR